MDWMIKVFFCILINGIVGSMAFGIWKMRSRKLEEQNRYMQNYNMLKIAIAFYIFPAPLLYVFIYPVRHLMAGYVGRFYLYHTPAEHVIRMLIGIWILGMCCAAFLYLKECRAVRKITRHNQELKDPAQTECFEHICLRRRFYRPVEVYENALISTPMIVGRGFRNLILFPDIHYNDQEFEIILEHETIHAMHRDLIAKKILIWIKIVIWFFPSVTAMLQALGDWSETACDIVMCGENDAVWSKKQYFEPMLNHLPVESVSLKSALALNTNQLELMTRMQRMKGYGARSDIKDMRIFFRFPVSVLASVVFFSMVLLGVQHIENFIYISAAEYQSGELYALGNPLVSKTSIMVGEWETASSRLFYADEGSTVTLSAVFNSRDCYSAIAELEDSAGNRERGGFIREGYLDKKSWKITENGYYRVVFYNEFGLPFRINYCVSSD